MIKVAEIVGNLNRGGVETWLKDVSIYYDRENIQLSFIKFTTEETAYDHLVTSQGARIEKIPMNEGLWKFSTGLYRTFRAEKYDIVHSHVHFISGYILLIAFLAGVKCRICHSHLDTSQEEKNAHKKRKWYIRIQKRLIDIFTTKRIACSTPAGDSLFGKKHYDTLYCGIDFSKFFKTGESTRTSILESLGLPADGVYVGHVGRLDTQKNHDFLIDIFYEFQKQVPNTWLLLVGEGPLRKQIEAKVEKYGLHNVKFLGGRDDVHLLMRDVFDVFILPSFNEGLPIVLMEAQSAGLKCLITDNIAKEGIVVKENVICLGLSQTADTWAEELHKLIDKAEATEDKDAAAIMIESPFSIQKSVAALEKLYTGKVK